MDLSNKVCPTETQKFLLENHITKEAYHGGELTGEHSDMVMDKIEKLEEKLMLAEDHWKQFIVKLALFLEKINPNLEAELNNFIDSLTLSKEELRDIFNTNSIFDNL